MKRISTLFSAALIVSCCSLSGNAQQVMDDVYGRGVHAYYAGQTDRSLEWLNQAIDAGSQDPRVYYYRGLATIRQTGGLVDAGIPDFEQAALLEVTSGRVVNVGKALERIQGSTRATIEDIRLRVRLENKDKLPRPPQVPTTPADPGSVVDPFGDDSGLTTGDPEVMQRPAPLDPAPADIPGGFEPTAPDATDDTVDPFGADDAPAEDAPATDADPFGSNPFN